MKTPLVLLCSVVVATWVPAQTSGTSSYPDKPMPDKTAPDTKKKDPAKKEEPKIEGVVVARGEKGFLGVEIVNSTFKITFYDAKKKKIAPDVARVALSWDPKYKQGKERVVLNLGSDGVSLSSPKNIRPPYVFKLFITLIKEPTESQDPTGETYVIDFRA